MPIIVKRIHETADKRFVIVGLDRTCLVKFRPDEELHPTQRDLAAAFLRSWRNRGMLNRRP